MATEKLRYIVTADTKGFSGPIKAIGALAVTALVAAVKVTADFEKELSKLRGISGATEKDMASLEAQARKLGRSTAYTAVQVAKAQTELAKLGFTTSEVLSSSGGVLDLAAGLGVELAEAAELTGSTLRQFGIDASETGKVVDILAKAATESALDFTSLKESLKLVGPIAGSVGVSIEETVGILETLADSGLKGSIAGTSLRKAFIELNAAGIPLKVALDKVKNSSDQLGTAVELVGKRAATAFVVLAENGYTAVSDFDGVANKLRETMEDNLIGDFTKLTSAITELGIAAGKTSTGPLRQLLQLLTGGASGLSDKLSFADLITKINTEIDNTDTKKFESVADAMRRIISPKLTDKGVESLNQFDTISAGLVQLGETADYIQGKAFKGVSGFFEKFGIDISDTNGNIEEIQKRLPQVLQKIYSLQKISSKGADGATPDLEPKVILSGISGNIFDALDIDEQEFFEGANNLAESFTKVFGESIEDLGPIIPVEDIEFIDPDNTGDLKEDLDSVFQQIGDWTQNNIDSLNQQIDGAFNSILSGSIADFAESFGKCTRRYRC